MLVGFRGFVYEFQTISINHTGIFARYLRTVFIPFFYNRDTGPTKGSSGIIWLGPGKAVREFLCAMHDKGGRRKLFCRTKGLSPAGYFKVLAQNKQNQQERLLGLCYARDQSFEIFTK